MTKLEEVMDENFVFAKYFQDSFIALPLPFKCDIWMRKKQPDFYIFFMRNSVFQLFSRISSHQKIVLFSSIPTM